MELNNCAALVTGGGSGLGAATAASLAANGAKVAIIDTNADNAAACAKEINGLAICADVTDSDAMQQALAQAAAEHGPTRICIQCAGIAPAKRVVGKNGPMPLAEFDKVIQVNLIGTFNVMRLVAAQMIEHEPTDSNDDERGVIINTSSVAAFEGQIGQSAYSAAKGGVAALCLPAARELARFGVRVMTIAPGLFATPMMAAMPDSVKQQLSNTVPFPKRLGKPNEYASLALEIVRNKMLNGSVIRLDGALRMQEK